MNKKISDIIFSTLDEITRLNNLKLPAELNYDTSLIGSKGVLDSLAFVSFLVAVEQEINRQFDKYISLSSEKAFSQKRNPFRSVGTLIQYITENWEDEQK
jgi:acyl carrier protein